MDNVKQPTVTTVQPIYNTDTIPIIKHPHQQQHYQQEYPHHPVTQPTAITKSQCESHMHRYVDVRTVDGCCYDGIVEHVDEEWICLAVPGVAEDLRGFFPQPPLYPPYGPFFPYRPRRFNRLVLPLAALTALSLLPYYW